MPGPVPQWSNAGIGATSDHYAAEEPHLIGPQLNSRDNADARSRLSSGTVIRRGSPQQWKLSILPAVRSLVLGESSEDTPRVRQGQKPPLVFSFTTGHQDAC